MDINSTLNATISSCNIPTFESVNAFMTQPIILTSLILILVIPIFTYIIIGLCAKGRSSSGEVMSKIMFAYPNAYYPFISFLIEALLILLLVFPIWLEFFQC